MLFKLIFRKDIVWRNVISLTLLHLGFLYTLCIGLKPEYPLYAFLIADVFGRFSALGILAGSHRLWSHCSYKAKLPLRIVLMILNTMALQNDIYDWARDHRVHHKFSDTDADPYNAQRGFFFSHIGWLMTKKHPQVREKGKTIDMSDVWNDPVVRFQRRFYMPLVVLFWGIIPTYTMKCFTNLPLFDCFVTATLFRYTFTLHNTWLVNSAAHMYGSQTYDQRVQPRQNRLVTYLTLGEGYHNYHHVFPWDYSASEHGWRQCFNPVTLFIDACAYFGLAYDRRKVNRENVRNRIEKSGSGNSRIVLITWKSVAIDYFAGLCVSYYYLIIMYSIRYTLNGKF